MIPLGVLASRRAVAAPPDPDFMTIFFDNFNRSNGALGSNWTTPLGAAAVWVNSNTAYANAGGSYGAALVSASPHPANQWSACDVTDSGAAGNTPYAEVIVRAHLSLNITGYALRVEPLGPSWTLIRYDFGTPTTLDSGPLAGFTNGDRMRIAVMGTTILGYWRDSLIAMETDATHGGGSPGIGAYRQRMRLDNFESGDLM